MTDQTKPGSEPLSNEARALLALRQMKARLREVTERQTEPIAVVGMACRFPGGSEDPEAFWELLARGGDGIVEVPPERWDIDAWYDPDPSVVGKMCTRWGGFLRGVDRFDPDFFDITPREAAAMDPQHRLLLEVAWEALENAAIVPRELAGSRGGVFVGLYNQDYGILQSTAVDAYMPIGVGPSFSSGRLAYLWDLQGPCMVVDTVCSSSLVTVHLACNALRTGEADVCLAGGVNLILAPASTVVYSRLLALSPEGRCRSFDSRAAGFVRSEGCGMVVLKRLSDARRDSDRIIAVIRGSDVNHDGRSNGLTAPNLIAQIAVLRRALARARVDPAEVSHIEAHGTGTPLGDPIEVDALKDVFGARESTTPLWLSSAKANVGHMEAAAGIGGLIKVLVSLQHDTVPPLATFQKLNPRISIEGTPLRIPLSPQAWPRGEQPRVAGVSSFGMSGTNAHVVVADAPAEADAPAPPLPARDAQLLVLSARHEEALRELCTAYAERLADPGVALGDVCFTANVGRTRFEHRLAVVATDREAMQERLRAAAEGGAPPRTVRGRVTGKGRTRVAFLFTGQGAQHPGMAGAIAAREPVFHAALARCDEILAPHLERRLLSVLEPSADPAILDRTEYTQPALFAVAWSLAELWRSWGVVPDAVIGHSVGELAGACVAGVLSLEEGLRLVATRGRLMQALGEPGAMAAVFAGEAEVAEVLRGVDAEGARLTVAACNGPTETVISGAADAVGSALALFEARNVRSRRLAVSHAFHSPLMDPMLDDFERAAGAVSFAAPRIDVVSNVSGTLVTAGELQRAAYWRAHVRAPVRFADGVRALYERGIRVFLELGPRPILCGMAGRSLPEDAVLIPSLRGAAEDEQHLIEAVGRLVVAGVRTDLRAFEQGRGGRKVALPTYPFQRKRYWSQADAAGAATASTAAAHPWLGRRLHAGIPLFETALTAASVGRPYLTAATILELASAAAREALGRTAVGVEALTLAEVVPLQTGGTGVQVVLHAAGEREVSFEVPFEVYALRGERWASCASGRLLTGSAALPGAPTFADARAACTTTVATGEDAVEVFAGDGASLARVRGSGTAGDGFSAHPFTASRCLEQRAAGDGPARVIGIERLLWPDGLGADVWVYARGDGEHDELTFFAAGGPERIVGVASGVARAPLAEALRAPATEAPRPRPAGPAAGLRDRLLAAAPRRRRAILLERLEHEVARVMGRELDDDHSGVDAFTGFFDLGMDSLMVVELKKAVEAALGVELATTVAFDYPTLDAMTEHLLALVTGSNGEARGSTHGGVAGNGAWRRALSVDQVKRMSEAELDAVVRDELRALLADDRARNGW